MWHKSHTRYHIKISAGGIHAFTGRGNHFITPPPPHHRNKRQEIEHYINTNVVCILIKKTYKKHSNVK
jgi:hypothetical protein